MIFFQVIDLSFPFPLFGGVHRQLTVLTAGALLTGNPDDKTPVPSHIAPFLSHMAPNERDTTIFYNEGNTTMADSTLLFWMQTDSLEWMGPTKCSNYNVT